MRRLLNIGAACVLVLSYWGSALAAQCPHGCDASRAAHSHTHPKQGGASAGGHCGSQTPAREAHHAPDASARGVTDVASSVGFGSSLTLPPFAPRSAAPSCGYCIRSGEPPAQPLAERLSHQLKKGGSMDAPAQAGAPAPVSSSFVREIIPYAESPPPRVHRHVLLSVFLI